MAGDFVSQLNIGALMLAELHGFLALPRKAKGGSTASPEPRDVELRGEEVGRFNSCPMVIDTRAPQTERRNQVAPCPRYRLSATPLSLTGHRPHLHPRCG